MSLRLFPKVLQFFYFRGIRSQLPKPGHQSISFRQLVRVVISADQIIENLRIPGEELGCSFKIPDALLFCSCRQRKLSRPFVEESGSVVLQSILAKRQPADVLFRRNENFNRRFGEAASKQESMGTTEIENSWARSRMI